MKDIQKNTIDVNVEVYSGPHEDLFRHVVKTDPDFPGLVVVAQQEQEDYIYKTFGEVKFDLETWVKIKYAVELVFEKSI